MELTLQARFVEVAPAVQESPAAGLTDEEADEAGSRRRAEPVAALASTRLQLRPEALRDPLVIGIAVSVLLHLALAVLKFAPPEPLRFAPADPRIEVVLLNAKTEQRPVKADVLAQVDMEGGGDRDEGRAQVAAAGRGHRVATAPTCSEQRRRVQELEEQQRRLLALARGPAGLRRDGAAPARRQPRPPGAATPRTWTRSIARLQAQIDRQISDYNKRPKRLTYGSTRSASPTRAMSRTGRPGSSASAPRAIRRRRAAGIYDSLIITVEIDRHGNVVDVILNRKSKYEVLNRAVREIVHAGAPYERFPPEMAREGDILQIVRTWTFTNDALATDRSSRHEPASRPRGATYARPLARRGLPAAGAARDR